MNGIEKVPLDFIVTGLPRSGTTWLANWLTTGASLCLHDPFAIGLPDAWPSDERLRGISCTFAYCVKPWLDQYDCPIAIIERDPADCDKSLSRIGLPDTHSYQHLLQDAKGRRFAFDNLWTEGGARELWDYLLPAVPFDALRYRVLQDMQIQPHTGKLHRNAETMRFIIDGGFVPWRF